MEVPNGKEVQSPKKRLVKSLVGVSPHTAITGTAHHTQGFPKSSGLGILLSLLSPYFILLIYLTKYPSSLTKLKQKPLILLKTQS